MNYELLVALEGLKEWPKIGTMNIEILPNHCTKVVQKLQENVK